MRLPHRLRLWRRHAFYGIVRALVALLRRGPASWGRGFLRALAAFAWRALPGERSVATRQIGIAMPHLGAAEVETLGRASFRTLGENLLDMVRADVPVEFSAGDRTRLRELLGEGPVLVLMAHAGAWELAGPALVEVTPRFGAIVADPHNQSLGAWLRRERTRRGVTCFDRDTEIAAAARWLRRGGCLAVLADHRPRGRSVRAAWFGAPAPTSTAPARLARLAAARILPLGIRRQADGHRIGLGEAFVPVGDPEGDAARCNTALEALILESPEEWTWFHDRYDGARPG